MSIDIPLTIVCVDCGGECHRLTPEPDEGFIVGAIIAYRCAECHDRWDLVFDTEE